MIFRTAIRTLPALFLSIATNCYSMDPCNNEQPTITRWKVTRELTSNEQKEWDKNIETIPVERTNVYQMRTDSETGEKTKEYGFMAFLRSYSQDSGLQAMMRQTKPPTSKPKKKKSTKKLKAQNVHKIKRGTSHKNLKINVFKLKKKEKPTKKKH